MLVKIGNFDYSEVWDGVFYKKLSDYPRVSDWEIRTIIEFVEYEKNYGRTCEIRCGDEGVRKAILAALEQKERYLSVPRPKLLTECTACPYRKGCVTDFVCHTTSADNAIRIFQCGKLLSARNARQISVEDLVNESRNAAKDPADYFEHIMFAWGNCQAGDRLVMERSLGRFPNDDDLSDGFKPGVRFYFGYEQLIGHPKAVCDGVLPVKVKDEIILVDWVFRIVIPMHLKETLKPHVPLNLADRVIYVAHDHEDIWDWSEKVYRLIEEQEAHSQS